MTGISTPLGEFKPADAGSFRPKSWGAHPKDLAKEYTAWEDAQTAQEATPDKPDSLSISLVKRGLIDPLTGLRTGNSKQEHISRWTPSEQFKTNYERAFGHA
jgi:hypothetical protein